MLTKDHIEVKVTPASYPLPQDGGGVKNHNAKISLTHRQIGDDSGLIDNSKIASSRLWHEIYGDLYEDVQRLREEVRYALVGRGIDIPANVMEKFSELLGKLHNPFDR